MIYFCRASSIPVIKPHDFAIPILHLRMPCRIVFFFSSRRRHTRFDCDWSSDVCSSDLIRATNQSSGALRRATTADDGSYTVGNLAPGAYTVSASLPGLKTQSQKDVQVRSEERRVGKECRSRWSPYH